MSRKLKWHLEAAKPLPDDSKEQRKDSKSFFGEINVVLGWLGGCVFRDDFCLVRIPGGRRVADGFVPTDGHSLRDKSERTAAIGFGVGERLNRCDLCCRMSVRQSRRWGAAKILPLLSGYFSSEREFETHRVTLDLFLGAAEKFLRMSYYRYFCADVRW